MPNLCSSKCRILNVIFWGIARLSKMSTSAELMQGQVEAAQFMRRLGITPHYARNANDGR